MQLGLIFIHINVLYLIRLRIKHTYYQKMKKNE